MDGFKQTLFDKVSFWVHVIFYKLYELFLFDLIPFLYFLTIAFENFEEVKVFDREEFVNTILYKLCFYWVFLGYEWFIDAKIQLDLFQSLKKITLVSIQVLIPGLFNVLFTWADLMFKLTPRFWVELSILRNIIFQIEVLCNLF